MAGFLRQTDEVFYCPVSGGWVTPRFDGLTPCGIAGCGVYQVKDLPDSAIVALVRRGDAVVKVRKQERYL